MILIVAHQVVVGQPRLMSAEKGQSYSATREAVRFGSLVAVFYPVSSLL